MGISASTGVLTVFDVYRAISVLETKKVNTRFHQKNFVVLPTGTGFLANFALLILYDILNPLSE